MRSSGDAGEFWAHCPAHMQESVPSLGAGAARRAGIARIRDLCYTIGRDWNRCHRGMAEVRTPVRFFVIATFASRVLRQRSEVEKTLTDSGPLPHLLW